MDEFENEELEIIEPLYTEAELAENQKLMKKSKRKITVFLFVSLALLLFFLFFHNNGLFIFSLSNAEEDLVGSQILFNFLSYVLIISTFIYMFFYLNYFNKRSKLTEEEQMKKFEGFKKHFNVFDLLGVVPVFLAILTFINGMFLGFATVVGPSMEPTFCSGDYVIIDHFSQNYEREDIMIFYHEDSKLIKRVVGLPGDTVEVNSTGVYINGVLLETYFPSSAYIPYNGVIPEGYYYVMGDNRHNSNDSRSFGLVAPDMILGEVVFQLGGETCSIE